jgi:hypothetical protein
VGARLDVVPVLAQAVAVGVVDHDVAGEPRRRDDPGEGGGLGRVREKMIYERKR